MTEEAPGYYASTPRRLPAAEGVNISALSRLFSNTTNSYKYVFFISILDILKRQQFDASQSITFQELAVEMLANAWFPHTYFKLSFGKQDQITKCLDSLPLKIEEPVLKFTDTDKKLLRQSIQEHDLRKITRKLQRYVPFLLLAPFFDQELVEFSRNNKRNSLEVFVPRVAEARFHESKPLYRFDSDNYSSCNSIILHPSWVSYLEKHYTIVRGWAAWEWLQYMQRRNPSTPGLVNKLFAPIKRESLFRQSAYWRIVLANTDFNCIYSGQKIDISNFSLDHYLPWSFVAHDQLWNLVPTTPEVNSSKSNNLPPTQAFEKFVSAQHLGLRTCHEKMSRSEWRKTIEVYINDLRIQNQSDLLDLDKLRAAYKESIQPLLLLATNQGFKQWYPPFAA